jgi:protein TonB
MTAYRYRPSLRSRATAVGLSLGICVLIVVMLIRMGALLPAKEKANSKLVAIAISQPPETPNAVKAHTVAKSAPRAIQRQQPVPVTQPQPRPAAPVPPAFINLSQAEFAAADIAGMPKRSAGGGQSGNGSAAYGPGEGPGGAKLYNAEWYREPTRAEMATYMPKRRSEGGWAVIACKTEERYHVTDCRELGESPPGSGLSRALRQAAWQFLVRPPRIDGRPVIGAWVRIRFDFSVKSVSEPTGDLPD